MSNLRARYSDLELSSPLAPSARESFCISCHEMRDNRASRIHCRRCMRLIRVWWSGIKTRSEFWSDLIDQHRLYSYRVCNEDNQMACSMPTSAFSTA